MSFPKELDILVETKHLFDFRFFVILIKVTTSASFYTDGLTNSLVTVRNNGCEHTKPGSLRAGEAQSTLKTE